MATRTTPKGTEAMLLAIMKKLERIEKIVEQPGMSDPAAIEKIKLRGLMEKMTIKRRAVLCATLGGLSYQQIADIMSVDLTTVKLHLRGALQILGLPNRSMLLVQKKDLLAPFSDREFHKLFGLKKSWWLEEDDELMSVLHTVKKTANQHTTA